MKIKIQVNFLSSSRIGTGVVNIFFLMCIGSNIMAKKHHIGCVHWLFDTFSKAGAKSKTIKPWEDLIKDVDQAITSVKDLEGKLNSPCFKGKPFDDFETQDSVLQVCLFFLHLPLRRLCIILTLPAPIPDKEKKLT